ncbi:hypothetical protein M0638_22155 [Roseomonas sp. NAR14]|uniref:Uncharacterized protein n=1 Tax=Roseomonas acroporae TaxID=2937791 RepID=A0A9X1YE98_9PROT|nr:hypothetical protein [Roseomonas acroporae]MCK8787082.1 hypothetical protein [Roseomonas acroporae]
MAEDDPRPTALPDIRAVLAVGLGTLLFLLVAMAGLGAWFRWAGPDTTIPAPTPVPPPRLETGPTTTRDALAPVQRAQREGYAWTDRAAGLVRIPVARAMEILAARGEAAWAPLEAPVPGIPLPVRPEAARPEPAGPSGAAGPGAAR